MSEHGASGGEIEYIGGSQENEVLIGEACLTKLGREDLIDQMVQTPDGRQIPYQNFLELCRDKAGNVVMAFLTADEADPSYPAQAAALNVALERVTNYGTAAPQ